MRNLNIQGEQWRSLPTDAITGSSSIGGHVVDVCWFDDTSRAVLTSDGWVIHCQDDDGDDNNNNNHNSVNCKWTTNISLVCSEPDTTSDSSWFHLTRMDDMSLVALNRRNGAIVTVNAKTGEAELVGEFEHGIHAGAWSPDKEILLLVTLTRQDDDDNDESSSDNRTLKSVLLSMNAQFEVLEEVDMESHRFIDYNNTYLSQDEEQQLSVSVCWRPDSSLFAVSSVDVVDTVRKVRIYKRETLQLHAIGRTEDGSGKLAPNIQPTPMAWAGIGCSQILASIQRKGTKVQQVAFFEPNGLRHREFPLRDDPTATHVKGMEWNLSSDLLAVTLQVPVDSVTVSKVQLWHRSNYHWYLKQEFRFPHQNVVATKFHPELPYTIMIMFESTLSFVEYDVRWDAATIDHSSPSCIAYVVDGRNVNATPFGHALLPPPMFASTLEFANPVSQMVTSRSRDSPFWGVALQSDGSVSIIGPDLDKKSMVPNFPRMAIMATALALPNLQSLRHVCIIKEATTSLAIIAATAPRTREEQEQVVEIEVTLQEDGSAEIQIKSTTSLNGRILAIVPWADASEGALIELENGDLLEYERTLDTVQQLTSCEVEPLLEPCPWIAGLRHCSKYSDGQHDRKRLIVGMSYKSRLYCHDLLLSDSVSSFNVSTDHHFLCYATAGSQCQLRFLSLHELCIFDPLLGSDEHNLLQGFEARNVERGSKLVAVIPDRPTAVLQMPRGNLEGVYPRALVLQHAIERIKLGDYKGAFTMMRTQKVDLNLIVDLDPHDFLRMETAKEFLKQVDNTDHLNLFISTLGNYDSTHARFMIPEWLRGQQVEQTEPYDFSTKVNECCRTLRRAMTNKDDARDEVMGTKNRYLLPILSTFAKEEPPKLRDALDLISELAMKGKHTPGTTPLFGDLAQHAIQYLAFLAEYELLFKTALSMYDYDMARAVARNSQMDPKVYLPLLRRYRELPQHYAKYEVDVKLGRFDEALKNLHLSKADSECLDRAAESDVPGSPTVGNDFSFCMKLIDDHHLYRLGLELFRDPEPRSRILVSLGDHLLKKRDASAALSVFMSSKPVDFERAKNAARICQDWRTYFQLLAQQQPDTNESEASLSLQLQMAVEISEELSAVSDGRTNRRDLLADAATVSYQYGNDANRAVDFLIQGELWNEGQRIARLNKSDSLIRRCIDAAVSYAKGTIIELDERGTSFCGGLTRYSEVLQIRRKALSEVEADEGSPEMDDTGSLFSAASNASNLSTASYTSSSSIGSMSSVISVKSTSSFSIVGTDVTRHKSKYNERGGKRRDRGKKVHKGRSKARPGSEEELDGIVQTLRSLCVDDMHRDVIEETITFLSREGEVETARQLYDEYLSVSTKVRNAQLRRLEDAAKEKLRIERQYRRDGVPRKEEKPHKVEAEVDSMCFSELSESLHQMFSFLPQPAF